MAKSKYRPIPKLTNKDLLRFWIKVNKGNKTECWPWKGSKLLGGYGRFRIGPHLYLATRIVLAIKGIQSNVLEVRHICNNPSCCNPNHLRLGTHAANMKDKVKIGRVKGVKNPKAKLTEIQVRLIRNLANKMLTLNLANLFNVSRNQIRMIRTRKQWPHVIGVATDKEVKAFLTKSKD
jgi:hypothetical protein